MSRRINTQPTLTELLAACVLNELRSAREKHPSPMNSAHEAYGVILEEMDEVWTEIKRKELNRAALRNELTQVAAMAIRAIEDLGI